EGKKDVAEAGLPFALRPGIHAITEGARTAPVRRDRPHRRLGAAFQNAGKNLKTGAAENVRDVLHDDRVAQIRFVGAVFAQSLAIGDARQFRRHRLAAAELLEHAANDRLDRVKHVVLGDEAHLQIELIELAGRTVGAGVLVAKAGCDLKVAVEAGDHDQLLELLRRLRQRVEFSGMQARRHQIIARAFRRRGGEDRRLEFEEALRLHVPAQRIDNLAALHDVAVQVLAAQIEKTVFEPDVFGIVVLAEHRHGQFHGAAQHLDLADVHFNLAGRQFSVLRAARPPPHLAVDAHHPFRAQRLGRFEGSAVGVGHHLREPVMVAHIDEQHAAMIADAMAPARKPHFAADIARSKRAAGMAAIAVHFQIRRRYGKWRAHKHMAAAALSSGHPRLDRTAPICHFTATGKREMPKKRKTARPAANAEIMTTADAVVATLFAHGLNTIYALPGVQNDHLFEALFKASDRLRTVHTRHEQGAALMALGAALATGKPQAYAVVPGPGLLNSATALLTAYAMNAPVLGLIGQIFHADIGRGLGHLHEIRDQHGVIKRLVDHAALIEKPEQASRQTALALRAMHSGRPGPAVLECAINVWGKSGPVVVQPPLPRPAPNIDRDAVRKAATILGAAKRPMIVCGGGAQDAATEVRALSAMLQAPVLAYRRGRGVLDGRSAFSVTLPLGHELWGEADAVLAVGTRLLMQF